MNTGDGRAAVDDGEPDQTMQARTASAPLDPATTLLSTTPTQARTAPTPLDPATAPLSTTPTQAQTASAPLDPATARLSAAAVEALTAFRPADPMQRRLREEYLTHLAAHPDAVVRSGPPVHLTASCLVIGESGSHVLLTHHRRAGRWFQFGGHLEPADPGVHAAATREAREESGIPTVTPLPGIIELNRHVLVGDFTRCREHLDIRFVATVPLSARHHTSEESIDVRWWPVDDLPEGPHGEVADLVRAGLAALSHR